VIFVRFFDIKTDLAFRRRQPALQHHVRIACVREREVRLCRPSEQVIGLLPPQRGDFEERS
jgi:hypothetical protein